jgi:tight adherence protein B
MISQDRLAFFAAALAAMLALFAWPARPVFAAVGGVARLSVVAQHGDTVSLRLSVDGLPDGTTFDPASARVTLDGHQLSDVSATADGAPGAARRRAMLVVDTSGSMAGAGVVGARRAADAYLTAVPSDVEVGLVTFADRPHVAVAPTTARAKVRLAVSHVSASGETSLYDAVVVAVHALGHRGDRSIVVLSDGEDTRSRHSRARVAARLRQSGARLDAVAFSTGASVRHHLAALAGASGGRVTSAADAAGLAASFSSAARTFSTGLTVLLRVPDNSENRVAHVVVAARTTAGLVQASTDITFAAATPPVASSLVSSAERPDGASGVPMSALLLVFLGLAGLSWAVLEFSADRRSPGARTKRLLSTYTYTDTTRSQESEDKEAPIGGTALSRAALRAANRIVANPARRDRLGIRLTRADVSFKPGEWLVVLMLVVVAVGMLGMLMFRSILGAMVLAVMGYLGSSIWLSIKGRRRLRAFDDQLPGSLQMVAGSLRAGFSLSQSLDAVVREGMQPIAGEIHRALAEVRLGVSMEDALDHIADRMDSTDFRWVVMAIRIQHEVGGNLAEVLLTTATTMRERASLRRQVKALSAEGRLSAYILLGLPVVMTLYMVTLRRAYIRPLYSEPMGIGMLVLAVLLLVAGTAWMRKIVVVEA